MEEVLLFQISLELINFPSNPTLNELFNDGRVTLTKDHCFAGSLLKGSWSVGLIVPLFPDAKISNLRHSVLDLVMLKSGEISEEEVTPPVGANTRKKSSEIDRSILETILKEPLSILANSDDRLLRPPTMWQ
ncbi:hypothetical protein WR25_16115 [Diploscapter pachys]|uniref:Uncharacterized protein n=1 Tax=Diploscapter pachys TaxID=2018661 RepID=A0A2A2LAR7_9BILA|nr:hypothetical protein WR25_16115 [Diploscapter pachys]